MKKKDEGTAWELLFRLRSPAPAPACCVKREQLQSFTPAAPISIKSTKKEEKRKLQSLDQSRRIGGKGKKSSGGLAKAEAIGHA